MWRLPENLINGIGYPKKYYIFFAFYAASAFLLFVRNVCAKSVCKNSAAANRKENIFLM